MDNFAHLLRRAAFKGCPFVWHHKHIMGRVFCLAELYPSVQEKIESVEITPEIPAFLEKPTIEMVSFSIEIFSGTEGMSPLSGSKNRKHQNNAPSAVIMLKASNKNTQIQRHVLCCTNSPTLPHPKHRHMAESDATHY